jgi:c-di-GMP-binding flagellar brake protein YcgR
VDLMLPEISEPLKLWEKIEIVIADGDDQGLYLARIEDFVEDGIVISNPELREGSRQLRDNCAVVALVIKEDAVYQFYSLLSKTEIEGKVLYVLTLPRDIQRVQRRQFVRLELVSDVSIADLGAKIVDQTAGWQDTVCVNISGGGMLIKSWESLEPPNLILAKADILSSLKIAQPIAAICRRTFCQDQQHYTGIEFIREDNLSHYVYESEMGRLPKTVRAFDHRAQNRLVTYIFQRQIELRKKGLI